MFLRLQIVSGLAVVGSYVLEGSGCEQVLTQSAIRVTTIAKNVFPHDIGDSKKKR